MEDRQAKIFNELSHLGQYLDETRERLESIDPPLAPVFMADMEYFMEQVCFYLEVLDG